MMYSYNRRKFLARHRFRRLSKRLNRHPYILSLIVLVAASSLSAILFFTLSGRTLRTNNANIVILYADHKTQSLPSREETVGAFLEKAEVSLNEGDVVEPSLDTKIQEDNFRVNVYRAAPVVVIDGDKKTHGLSAALTPRSMAEQVGSRLHAEDNVVTEPSDDFLRDGSIGNKVVIDRATPATLNLYGTQLSLRTQAETVGDLLSEKEVKLNRGDKVQPGMETPLSEDIQVFVTRFGTKVITKKLEIKPPTEYIEDSSLSFGTTAVRQKGVPGERTVTYQIKLVNGREKSRKIIQQVIIRPAVKEIVARGRAVAISGDKETWMAAAGVARSDYPYVNYIISRESGWCPTKWQGQIGYCPEYYTALHSPDSGYGFGLCQSTPAGKMASAGADWETNPVTQMKWCSGYAIGRYGSWGGAYEWWLSHSWW